MTLTLENDDFGKIARSSSLDDAMKEPNFIARAMKLFDLRESLWSAFDKTNEEIDEVTEERVDKRAGIPTLIGFGLGFAAGVVGLSMLVGIPLLAFGAAEMLFGGIVGLLTGGLSAWIGHSIAASGPESEGDEAHDAIKKQNKKMQATIEGEISTMDKSLFSQEPSVRDEFRSAFRHAALKMEVRENRIHRAKMEEEAEETREAAQTAATMASVAAMSAAMNSGRR
jgi:hypothetical protein